jgi:hypothetical protein
MTTLQQTDDEFHFDFHQARTKFTFLRGAGAGSAAGSFNWRNIHGGDCV